MKRKKPLRRRTWIARLSRKKKAQTMEYFKRRDDFLSLRRHCEIRQTSPCKERASLSREVHHRAGRHGKYLLDESKWCASCKPCHRWAHKHPGEARKLGIIIDPTP